MALNLNLIGKRTEPIPYTYDEDKVILYALGIGAGVEELDFVYEKDLKVFPTFAVIPGFPAIRTVMADLGHNRARILHGEQKIIMHNPIPVSGTIYTTGVLTSVYDKGDNGAIMNVSLETRDEKGQLLFENRVATVDRSAGNFGGDRGPKAQRFNPPEGKAPDFEVTYATSPDQAALYRLSGDKILLHIDPDFAKKGGFDRPILHGLCTYGYAGRAIVHSLCAGDPARLKSFAARFMNVVFPGETLITKGWRLDKEKCIIQVTAQDGRMVLGNSVAEVL